MNRGSNKRKGLYLERLGEKFGFKRKFNIEEDSQLSFLYPMLPGEYIRTAFFGALNKPILIITDYRVFVLDDNAYNVFRLKTLSKALYTPGAITFDYGADSRKSYNIAASFPAEEENSKIKFNTILHYYLFKDNF